MKSKSSIFAISNGTECQFKSLTNNEMINLRGGEIPPIPPTGGEDFPIDLLKMSASSTTDYSKQKLPLLKKPL